VKDHLLARWQANFWAGLAIVLPGVISIGALLWLFGTVSRMTDTLLIFVPRKITHENGGLGSMYWYWSVVAIVLAVFLVGLVGLIARYYFGKRIIEWVDSALLSVPLLNKIYGAIKQVNEAFSASNKNAFRTVVLVEFPRPGSYSMGFLTTEQQEAVRPKSGEKLVGVFIPTTPNPTSGFLLLVEEDKVTKLDMSVAEGIKYIVSLGSILPDSAPAGSRQKGSVLELGPLAK
jgi:uncharacterized membrane protein